MKELWIEIAKTASPAERDNLLKLASKSADALLEDTKAHSNLCNCDISVLTHFDGNELAKLKHENKKVAVKISIKGKEDENTAARAAELQVDYIILNCQDWRVIPLENLIARTRGKTKLIAETTNVKEAQLVLETLELGTDGVLLKTVDPNEITKTIQLIKNRTAKIELTTAKITAIQQIGTGARVCVDTCDLMTQGEGILVGCQSAGFFLVEAEVHENPYVQPRPFRVNAGSLSMYTLAPQQRTRYLSELKAGEEVLIIDRKGNVRPTNVGRVKIEKRPLILIEAKAQGTQIKTILQNAETIHLVTPDDSKPVTELKPDDDVVVQIAAKGGRHFGVTVPDETVIER